MRLRLLLVIVAIVVLAPVLLWRSCGPQEPVSGTLQPPATSPKPSPSAGSTGPLQESAWDALGGLILDLQRGNLNRALSPQARQASWAAPLLERYQASLQGRNPGPAASEEEALAYEYLFGSPEAASRSLEALGRTFCAWRMGRVWPGTRRQPPPDPLPDWARCPVAGQPYRREPEALLCAFHDQRFSVQHPNAANLPSELYPQLAMGYFGAERGQGLDVVMEPAVPSGVRPGETVVDFGCGVGCYTWAMARRVGPAGRVLAVDIDRGALDFVAFVAARRGMRQVRTVLASRNSPNLARDTVDRIFLIDVYNVIAGIDLGVSGQPGPRAVHVMQKLVNSLKTGGHLVLVDFTPQPGLLHVSEDQAIRDLRDLGLDLVDRRPAREGKMYALTFKKP